MAPAEGVAAIGSFDPGKTREALSNHTDWAEKAVEIYAIEEYNGVTIHSWGDGIHHHLQIRRSPPVFDNLGRARPLAVTDTYLFSEARIEIVKQMIDASQNKAESLADLKQYASIARVLADLNVTTALISDGAQANSLFNTSIDDAEAFKSALSPLLKNFLTFGTAPAKDSKGTYIAVVLYHENAQLAKENVSLFQQRIQNGRTLFPGGAWNEFFTSTDIKAEGNLLIAKLYTERTSYYDDWIYLNDGFLSHEE
jgi:hypothetical protein